MIINVEEVAYGRPASQALARSIGQAQAASALAPVTVVVNSNFVGLGARRLLGSGQLGLAGIANVSFITPFRLAQLLGTDQLLATCPLTNAVLGAAVRQTLAAQPGPFAAVAQHHATEAALAGLYSELSNVTPAALERVGGHGAIAGAAVLLHRAVAQRLGRFHDEAAVATAAAQRPLLALALEPFGQFIWYLPAPLHPPLAHLLSIVLGVAPSTVVVGLTGDDEADAAVRRACRLVGVGPATPRVAAPAVAPVADHLVSVSDADEEVRAVLRRVLALAEAGVALDRVGVFYPAPSPYLAILEQQLAAAAIPANGPSRVRLADSVAGRSLLGALALPAQQWRRDRVLAVISGAPLRHGGGAVRPVAWEALSREAGVVAGLGDWEHKLDRHRQRLLSRPARPADATETTGDGDHRVGEVEGLGNFVADLAAAVGRVGEARGWAAHARAGEELLARLLGQDSHRQHWPEPERDAFEGVQGALRRLAELDDIEPEPGAEVFRRALANELDRAGSRNGRFGQGVLYGPLASAVGLDLDAVFVLGCVEGLCPTSQRPDSLLSDAARAEAGGQLELRESRRHDQHRALLAALAAAPAGRRTLVLSRGELRGSRRTLPSRWLLDSASARAGVTVHATDFERLEAPVVEVVASFAAGVVGASVHVDVHQRDLATLAATREPGQHPEQHPLSALVGTGFALQAARRSPQFTIWDGNLAGAAVPATDLQPLSSSRLETWAACGFRYFLAHLLRLSERDDPERVLQINAQDRGSGMHKILERFLAEVLSEGGLAPDQAWSAAQRARLAAIAAEVFEDYEERGRTGRLIRWRLQRAQLLDTLEHFLDVDNVHRAQRQARPERVEFPFGTGAAPPVRIVIPNGRVLSFQGWADRVDRAQDGTLLVSDYKTGKADRYQAVVSGDPVQAGQTLQLGLYAEAAQQLLGSERAEAHYWMLSPEGDHLRQGYPWTPERRARFVEVVATIVEGIEAGLFPAAPGQWNNFFNTNETCRHCEFDRLCPHDRSEMAEAKVAAPQLRGRAALAGTGAADPADERPGNGSEDPS